MTAEVKSYSALELDTLDCAVNYLVHGILVEGQPAILAGPRKSLKTTLALDLALALSTGSPFLNRFRVERKMRVVFLSGESGLGTIQETARRISKAKGIPLAEVGNNLLVSEFLPKFENQANFAWVAPR